MLNELLTLWHWLAIALALIIMELLLVNSVYLLWIGIAAAVTGLIVAIFPQLGWEFQFLVFGVLACISIINTLIYKRREANKIERNLLNRRGEQYIGRSFNLSQAITNGIGQIQVDDTFWRVKGNDLPAGAKVKVVGTEGVFLLVKAE